MTSRRRATVWLLAAAVGVAVACTSGTTAPGAPKFATHLTITAQPRMAPGTQAQFIDSITWSDGTETDGTSSSLWTSSNRSVLDITSSGLASAKSEGLAHVSVGSGTVRSSLDVYVLPPGTFVLSGQVADSFGPLASASVIVGSSGGTLRKLSTDISGAFLAVGVGGDVTLQAVLFGYQTDTRSLSVSADTVANFVLLPVQPPADISGNWLMTLSADPSCANQLPAEARQRTFMATITQQGPHFTAKIASPTTTVAGSVTDGFILGSSFSFDLPLDYYNIGDDLTDRLSPSQWTVFTGLITGTSGAPPVAARWDGGLLDHESASGPSNFPTASCDGANGAARFERPGVSSKDRKR